jgi:hypothetical protein
MSSPPPKPRSLPVQANNVPALAGRLRPWRRGAACVLVAALLPACAPTLDWRTVQVPGTQLLAELPCRPGRFQREVVVAGERLTLFMLSCEAGGVTYGIATAELGDPARVDPVLHALADAARDAIRSSGSPFAALNMGGTTPFTGNSSARLRGTRPDGQAVDESIRVFARGARVFQASAIGAGLPDAARTPFEDGLRFDLARSPGDAG